MKILRSFHGWHLVFLEKTATVYLTFYYLTMFSLLIHHFSDFHCLHQFFNFNFKDMHYKFCVSVRNNWDKYVTFCKKILKSMTFRFVSTVLLEYTWKMINGSHRWSQRFISLFLIALRTQFHDRFLVLLFYLRFDQIGNKLQQSFRNQRQVYKVYKMSTLHPICLIMSF